MASSSVVTMQRRRGYSLVATPPVVRSGAGAFTLASDGAQPDESRSAALDVTLSRRR